MRTLLLDSCVGVVLGLALGSAIASRAGTPLRSVADVCAAHPGRVCDRLKEAAGDPLPFLLGDVPGFADLHVHQFAGDAFAKLVFGPLRTDQFSSCDPFGPDDDPGAQEHPSCVCSDHGLASLTGIAAGLFTCDGDGRHDPGFHLPLAHWGRFDRWAHQQHHTLKRAVDDGLGLIVLSAVSNQVLCRQSKGGSATYCNEKERIEAEIDDAWAFDRQNSWYRVALTPGQANHARAAGQLAVVLSTEGSDWFAGPARNGALTAPTEGAMDALLDRMQWDLGVRVILAVHQWNNPIGGAALHEYPNLLIAADQDGAADSAWHPPNVPLWKELCLAVPSSCGHFGLGTDDPQPASWPIPAEHVGTDADGYWRNRLGLTALGEALVTDVAERGLILDLAHLSEKAQQRALQMMDQARPGGPVILSHARYRDSIVLSARDRETNSEYFPPDTLLRQIADRGGMVGLRPSGDVTLTRSIDGGAGVANTCDGSARSLAQSLLAGSAIGVRQAFGSDMNGGALQTRPRAPHLGKDHDDESHGWACSAGHRGQARIDQWKLQVEGAADEGRLSKFGEDGLGSMGLEGSLVADLQRVGLPTTGLWSSADAFEDLWMRALPGAPAAPPIASTSLVANSSGARALDPMADEVAWAVEDRRADGRVPVGWDADTDAGVDRVRQDIAGTYQTLLGVPLQVSRTRGLELRTIPIDLDRLLRDAPLNKGVRWDGAFDPRGRPVFPGQPPVRVERPPVVP